MGFGSTLRICAVLFALFFFSFQAVTFDYSPANSASVHCSWVPQTSLFSNFFIKNRFHDTIHTFKNYFTTMFSVFSFQFSVFSKNKLYPYRPIVWARIRFIFFISLPWQIYFSLALYLSHSLKSHYPLHFRPISSSDHLVSSLKSSFFMYSCILDLGFGVFENFWGFWDFCEIVGLGVFVFRYMLMDYILIAL